MKICTVSWVTVIGFVLLPSLCWGLKCYMCASGGLTRQQLASCNAPVISNCSESYPNATEFSCTTTTGCGLGGFVETKGCLPTASTNRCDDVGGILHTCSCSGDLCNSGPLRKCPPTIKSSSTMELASPLAIWIIAITGFLSLTTLYK